MNILLKAVTLSILAVQSFAGLDDDRAKPVPTLKQITAEQDWIARSPQNPRWLIDGSAIRFSTRREGLIGRDFSDSYLISMSDLTAEPVQITPDNPGPYFTNSGDWRNHDGTACLITNAGDIFVYNTGTQRTTQLTKSTSRESSAFFLSTNSNNKIRLAFSRDGSWFIRDLFSFTEFQAADIKFTDAPKDKDDPDYDYLEQQQRDLFQIITLQDQRDDLREDDRKAWRDTNPTAVPGPFYMGKDRRSMGTSLSPSGNHVLVTTAPSKRNDSKNDIMPNYVTDDGYVSTRSVRTKVGLEHETPIQLVLLDLKNETIINLSLDDLPTIKDNPLAWLVEFNADEEADEEATDETEDSEEEPEAMPRPVSSMGVRWNDAGTTAAIMLVSHDNKDRWIVLVDTTAEEPTITVAHHLRNEAWIGWGFNAFGFIPNSDTLYYLSEESGYGHLYTRTPNGETKQLTKGNFEVRSLAFTNDGSLAYMRTNRFHPGIQEIERLHFQTGGLTPITSMAGTVESYRLSPDESKLILTYSNLNSPPELYLLDLETDTKPKRITKTITDQFLSFNFQTPQIIAVPSTHTEQPIYTR
ncbi:MAG: DPP IV N-terminal domain-containing protein, partial [Phycisphaerales bacterium]|nr:DPP IV N-terminal domain-containing protein [Phycisphaerales bacterium]